MILSRVEIRVPSIDTILANELIKTASERIMLKVGQPNKTLPSELESICVEVVTAMYRRHQMNHEGVDSESVDAFSIKFVNGLLNEYADELAQYKRLSEQQEDSTRGKLRFI